MLDAARIGPKSQVLDVGTGTGDTAVLAAELVGPTGRVIAIDASAEMLNVAAESARASGLDHIEFRQMDGGNLALERMRDGDSVLVAGVTLLASATR